MGLKDISRNSVLPFPSSINPSDAAQQLTRSIKDSTSDIRSHKGLSSTDWIPGWEYPLKKSFALAIAPDKPLTAPLTTLLMMFWTGVARPRSRIDRTGGVHALPGVTAQPLRPHRHGGQLHQVA